MTIPSETLPSETLSTVPHATARVSGRPSTGALATLDALAAIPEEELWLQSQRSPHTRRAYKEDVRHFMQTFGITTREELHQVSRAAVIAWIRTMETQGDMPRTVRRRLWALSSLFRHLIDQHVVTANPVRDLKRPAVERNQGVTAAFDAAQARAILDAPTVETIEGLRDRAILSVLLQAGPRRAEVAGMKVKDLHTKRGYPSLRTIRKSGKQHSLSLHPQTAQRIQENLQTSGHGEDLEGPLFRAVRTNGKDAQARRHLDPDRIDRIVRKYTQQALGIAGGFRRTRVGRRLRRARCLMAVRWRRCRRRWVMPTAGPRSFTTNGETIPSAAPPSLPTFRAERIPTASEMSETILTPARQESETR